MSDSKIERWERLADQDPDNPLHRFALARACAAAGEWERAEATYARCLELDPQWMVAAIQRGRCLLELERWDEARAALERGAELAQAQSHEEPFEEIRELMDRLPPD